MLVLFCFLTVLLADCEQSSSVYGRSTPLFFIQTVMNLDNIDISIMSSNVDHKMNTMSYLTQHSKMEKSYRCIMFLNDQQNNQKLELKLC